ncbi:GNAT family N-acetyltransferase [Qipengyuania flava]|uniref:GNAT family N-acetyltransferase n=1 Tax=Qipengyuania flava TaxID=192812 RepID=UPI001E361159|nr:GNAT family N-acetyltransferase [Qipengyuania flava]
MNIAVSYHETLTKLQGLDWPAQGPFDRLDWFALLDDPLYALAESGRGRVLLPLQRERRQLASLANWFSFTWRPLGDDPALLAALAHDLRRQTHRVELAPLTDEDGSATALEIAFRDAGWLVAREVCDENHVLPVAGRSFAEYWATRPGKMRTTLKRKARKVEITILTHFDEAAWVEYRAVYESSWKPQEERADLLEAFARAEGAAGRIRLGIARAAGEPVAAQFWTVENGTAYIHKLAHIEAAKPLSAGTTLSAALFEHAIDIDGVELVDFGTGSDGYKRDWMEANRPRYRLTCLDWRNPRAWSAIAKARFRHLAPHNRPS